MNPNIEQAGQYLSASVGTPQFKHASRIYTDLLKPEGKTNTLTPRELRELQLPELKARLEIRDRQDEITHFEALERMAITEVIEEINLLILDALKPVTEEKIKSMTTEAILCRINDVLNVAGDKELNRHESHLIKLLREGLVDRYNDLERQRIEMEKRGVCVEEVPKHLRILEHLSEISEHINIKI